VNIGVRVAPEAWAFADWSTERLRWFFVGQVHHTVDPVTGRVALTPPAWAARADEAAVLAGTWAGVPWAQPEARLWERVAARAEAVRRPQPWHVVEGSEYARPEGLAALGRVNGRWGGRTAGTDGA
jgi:hypothetical protein